MQLSDRQQALEVSMEPGLDPVAIIISVKLMKLTRKTYTTAPATGVYAFSRHISASRVSHLLMCLAHESDGERRQLGSLYFHQLRGRITSSEMEAAFEDVLCPLINCPPVLLHSETGEETKTSL